MFPASNTMIVGGTFNNYQNRSSRGIDILMEWVATGAFHNSDELYDAPKCHPHTRIAVLEDIMKWVNESESEEDEFMMWLFGPAGAGKSAIAKRIAEIAAERDLLIADFFFSRSSPTRNTKDRLIATLAYQLTVSIPDTRSYMEDAIERDPAIFNKNIQTQIDALLIKPYLSVSSAPTVPSQKLIIIDGLDECNDNQSQVAILEAISRSFFQHDLPIKILVVSRPEIHLVTLFTSNALLKSIHRRLALDDTYQPDDDIRLFFTDKFEQIRLTHPLKSAIPISWPTEEMLKTLVEKSSGQFIYASTVVKFVESICHRPSSRLNIILGISPPGTTNPFAELDALYDHLLSTVDDVQLTLRVLSFYIMIPEFASGLHYSQAKYDMSAELFLSLEPGDIQLALLNLHSIVTYDESSGWVEVMHASFVDFLCDKRRSSTFYIDMASTCADVVRRILQYVKGPDGIRAGNFALFDAMNELFACIPKGQLRGDILNFDLDAFITASLAQKYKVQSSYISGSAVKTFKMWMEFLDEAGLEEIDKKEALDRLNKSFNSRLQIYQSDRRLQLLLTLAVTHIKFYPHVVPYCRCVDILLGMDDHNLHLIDQDALELRHLNVVYQFERIGTKYQVDGDAYASGALHCLRFLSNPPTYTERNEHPEMRLIYIEWRETCSTALDKLCSLLKQANTSPELVQFISNHDIHPAIQRHLSADYLCKVLLVDAYTYILAFLSRASVCVNWRIVSAIQQSLIKNDSDSQPPSKFDGIIYRPPDGPEDFGETRQLILQRLDQCCLNVAAH